MRMSRIPLFVLVTCLAAAADKPNTSKKAAVATKRSDAQLQHMAEAAAKAAKAAAASPVPPNCYADPSHTYMICQSANVDIDRAIPRKGPHGESRDCPNLEECSKRNTATVYLPPGANVLGYRWFTTAYGGWASEEGPWRETKVGQDAWFETYAPSCQDFPPTAKVCTNDFRNWATDRRRSAYFEVHWQ